MDRMEKNGFISGQRGSKARDVFLTESDLDTDLLNRWNIKCKSYNSIAESINA